jgi:hypothetical protein
MIFYFKDDKIQYEFEFRGHWIFIKQISKFCTRSYSMIYPKNMDYSFFGSCEENYLSNNAKNFLNRIVKLEIFQ